MRVFWGINKAIRYPLSGFKAWSGIIGPGILIGFYFFIFFLLLAGCAYFQKEKPTVLRSLVVPPDGLNDSQNTIACIKLQPECNPDQEN